MLSPDVGTAIDLVTEAYSDLLQVADYGMRCNSLRIGHVSEDPEWLISVRSRVDKLREVMNVFLKEKSTILSEVLGAFIHYDNLFSAFAEQSGHVSGTKQWEKFLVPVRDALKRSMQQTADASDQFKNAYNDVENAQFLLEQSINEGWQTLASEEQQMISIAKAMGHLEESISNVGENINAADLRAGKSYIRTTVTMMYSVVAGATSVPYLSIAGGLFTIGKGVYDMLEAAKEIREELDELAELQMDASAAAQAMAITKTVIQVLDSMSKSFLRIDSSMPALTLMWQSELNKIESAMDALESGADPAMLFDLQTMKISAASWETLSDYAKKLSKPMDAGEPVTINCENDSIITKKEGAEYVR